MGVDKPSGMRVARIAGVRMLNRGLGERKEQARHHAEMNYAAHVGFNCISPRPLKIERDLLAAVKNK